MAKKHWYQEREGHRLCGLFGIPPPLISIIDAMVWSSWRNKKKHPNSPLKPHCLALGSHRCPRPSVAVGGEYGGSSITPLFYQWCRPPFGLPWFPIVDVVLWWREKHAYIRNEKIKFVFLILKSFITHVVL